MSWQPAPLTMRTDLVHGGRDEPARIGPDGTYEWSLMLRAFVQEKSPPDLA